MPTFDATIESNGKTATGIEVPPEVVRALVGDGKRAKVTATIGTFSYRTSVASMGGRFLVPVSADVRTGAGVVAGDRVAVTLELDTAERTIEVPDDLAAALTPHPEARAFFDGLSFSQQRWFVEGITGAKKPETRQRRVDAAVERLREGRGQR